MSGTALPGAYGSITEMSVELEALEELTGQKVFGPYLWPGEPRSGRLRGELQAGRVLGWHGSS